MNHSDDLDLVIYQNVVQPVGKAPERSPPDVEMSDWIEKGIFLNPRKGAVNRDQERISQARLALLVPLRRLIDLTLYSGLGGRAS